jgi:hypothetical protein
MKKLVALLFVAILAGSVTIPNVFSDDGQVGCCHFGQANTQENDTHNENETSDNQENDNKLHMKFGYSNATSINITLPNGTQMTFSYSNGTNPGQQISSFVHQLRDIFKQQENLSKQAIKDCRQKARDSSPADRKSILGQCKTDLKQINQQFHSEHKQLQLDFKQFRNMVISNNHTKSLTQNDIKTLHTTQIHTIQHGHAQNLKQHGNGHQNHGRHG